MTAENLDDSATSLQPEETNAPPAAVLLPGHFSERAGYAVYRPHGSGNWLLTFTVAGQGRYRQPGVSLIASPGDLVLLAPNAFHDYSTFSEEAWEFWWVHFQPRPAWLDWWRMPEVGHGLSHCHLADVEDRKRVELAFARLHADAVAFEALWTETGGADRTPGVLQSELALNGLEEILLVAARRELREGQASLDPRVQRVLTAIVADLAAPHDVESLADLVALSASRLSHLFAAEVGDSVMNVVRTVRLRRAARLLESTDQSVSEIANEVGFASAFYFSRQFSRQFGLSPRAYRARLRSG